MFPVLQNNERVALMDRALHAVNILSPDNQGWPKDYEFSPEEKAAYNAALRYLTKEFGRGWRADRPLAMMTGVAPDATEAKPPVEEDSEQGEEQAV